MGANSKIEWTDHTFNPWWGCVKVSPGCQHCYADTLAKRTGHNVWGPAKTTPRRTFGVAHWNDPRKWNLAAQESGVRRRVFCASMADVFEDHPEANHERLRLWALIQNTPWLDWQLLTKRPENIAGMLPDDWGQGYSNVWLGTSVEDQPRADERIPELLKVPAIVRFLSCEPLIGPLNFRWTMYAHEATGETYRKYLERNGRCGEYEGLRGIHWIIVGGESGAGARPMEIEWARTLRDQCAGAGIAFFLKQLGGVRDKRGGDQAVLDGVRHTAMPTRALSR